MHPLFFLLSRVQRSACAPEDSRCATTPTTDMASDSTILPLLCTSFGHAVDCRQGSLPASGNVDINCHIFRSYNVRLLLQCSYLTTQCRKKKGAEVGDFIYREFCRCARLAGSQQGYAADNGGAGHGSLEHQRRGVLHAEINPSLAAEVDGRQLPLRGVL